jgi:hypothetical protein
MRRFNILLLSAMLPLIVFTQSIKQNTTAPSAPQGGTNVADTGVEEAWRLVNKLAALYEGCENENEALQAEMDNCTQYQAQCGTAFGHCNEIISSKSLLLSQRDSIINLQRLEINNFHKEVRDDKQISIRRIAGFSVGGFLIGVSLPLVVYFFRK